MTIEINLQKLDRGTKKEWKTVTRGGKTFKQRFATGKKDKPTGVTMSILTDLKPNSDMSSMDFAKEHGWNAEKSEFFNSFISSETYTFMKDNKMFALGDFEMDEEESWLDIGILEVNPDMRRQGFGVEAMKEIVNHALKNNIKTIELSSMDENSDKFYTAIGMEEKGKVLMTHYEGDEAWMKAFLKAK